MKLGYHTGFLNISEAMDSTVLMSFGSVGIETSQTVHPGALLQLSLAATM